MKLAAVLAAGLVGSLVGGCATLTRGTTQDFDVITDPPGASVSTTLPDGTGGMRGCAPTPCSVEVPRRSEFIARIALDGHQELAIAVRSTSDRDAVSLNTLGTSAGSGGGYLVGLAADAGVAVTSVGVAGATAVIGAGMVTFGSPILFVDASTGALSTVTPNPVDIVLTPLETGAEAVRFVDPQALPGEAEARAQAFAKASTLGEVYDLSAFEEANIAGVAEWRRELAEIEAEYEQGCYGTKGPRAPYKTCRELRRKRRAVTAEIANAILKARRPEAASDLGLDAP